MTYTEALPSVGTSTSGGELFDLSLKQLMFQKKKIMKEKELKILI